jgi:3-methylfumaryl-CoA hydratase
MTTARTDGALSELAASWSPPATETHDVASAHRVRELAATLNVEHGGAEGDALPPLWHWTHFLDWMPTRELGTDGRPRGGHFLPPIPNRRRMFAGGRVKIEAALTIGEVAVRRSTLCGKAVKRGRTGEMLFVTLRHEYLQGDRLRLTEEQDLVYRSNASTPTSQPPIAEPLGERTAPWSTTPELHPALLFRFSALTGNAHRIHYDQAYTTGVEGFPALVVHGPLLALYMAELPRDHGADIRTFDFRLSRPVFVADAIRVQGSPSDDCSPAELEVVSGDGTVHATGSASFRIEPSPGRRGIRRSSDGMPPHRLPQTDRRKGRCQPHANDPVTHDFR